MIKECLVCDQVTPPPSGGSVIGRQKGREALSNPPWGLALEYAGQCVVHTAAPKAGGGGVAIVWA